MCARRAGNLDVYCTRTQPGYTPFLFARIAQELLAGVRYMHAQGIAHRDLVNLQSLCSDPCSALRLLSYRFTFPCICNANFLVRMWHD